MAITVRPNTTDEVIYNNVVINDEYPAHIFKSSDTVLDIGLHIGCYSYKAWLQGSRQIFGYEPETENFKLANENLKEYEGISIYNCAVTRSDKDFKYYMFKNRDPKDTWGHNIYQNSSGIEVNTIKFDEVLRSLGQIQFLKLDCEGSEFPILYTSKLLNQVDELFVETHNIDNPPENINVVGRLFNRESLVDFLLQSKFSILHTEQQSELIGKIWARRNDAKI